MVEGPLKKGDTVQHLNTLGTYKIVGLCSVKNPTNRDWSDAVMYARVFDEPPRIYVREERDFRESFRRPS